MQLAQFLDRHHIILELQSRERFACLEEILDRAAPEGHLRNKVKALDELLEREQLATTGIGGGIAVPHVFTDEARRPLVIMARSREGVDFEALDKKPVHLIFVAMASRKDKDLFINILYYLVKFLKVRANYDALMEGADVPAILEVMARAKENLLAEELKRLVEDEGRPGRIPQVGTSS
jgi:mannitol/fructose-specific phosphotransferase system IIA component (Ntr-type)